MVFHAIEKSSAMKSPLAPDLSRYVALRPPGTMVSAVEDLFMLNVPPAQVRPSAWRVLFKQTFAVLLRTQISDNLGVSAA